VLAAAGAQNRVALFHHTAYRYDRPVALSPHEIRLKPAPHCRTPIHSYVLEVLPEEHRMHWRHDIYGNHVARCVFPGKTRELDIKVELTADVTPLNPFDFLVDPAAEKFPFVYPGQKSRDLAPFLALDPAGPLFARAAARYRDLHAGASTVDLLVGLARELHRDIAYRERMDPGVQSIELTLGAKSGSCRDSGWLLVQLLRKLGVAARFVSGYLIELADDTRLPDAGERQKDYAGLHAWAEAYLPGAGWIGLDPTSGLLAAERHIPLACATASPAAAAITGSTEPCRSEIEFEMRATRI